MLGMDEINVPLFPKTKGGTVGKAKAETLEIQKEFIHNISSPLAVVQGMVEIVLTQLKADDKIDQKVIVRLEKVLVATVKIDSLLKANREFLTEESLGIQ
jgi:hypothetical protein